MKFGNFDNEKKSRSYSLKEEKLGTVWSEAMDGQIFYNNRKCIFDCLERCGAVDYAVLNMTFSKGKVGLFTRIFAPYHVEYSIVCKMSNGESRICKKFFEQDFSRDGSLLPKYILEALQDDDKFNINLDETDLQNLYNELDVRVDETATFESILSVCKKKHVSFIRLIDRVFYTRVECYSSTNRCLGVLHIGKLTGISHSVLKKLYPGGEVEYTL